MKTNEISFCKTFACVSTKLAHSFGSFFFLSSNKKIKIIMKRKKKKTIISIKLKTLLRAFN